MGLCAMLLAGCQKDVLPDINYNSNGIAVPEGFPNIEFPDDNGFSEARWELGKKLFFEKRLSADGTVSCASCHQPHLAFSDDVSMSTGTAGKPGTQNAPTLTNVAYHPYFTRAGGVPSLEMQILVPFQEHNEFGLNIVDAAERLAMDDYYREMSLESYGRSFDYFVITRAIATFERSLVSGNSSYDQFFYQNVSTALSPSAWRGMQLFFSEKSHCSTCHSGFNFTNYSFQNNGLYDAYADQGRKRLTGIAEDLALFKVPTLRNVEMTAPYMHDGSLSSLEQVIEHYNSGGKPHANKGALISPLNLTRREKEDLAAFLRSLTDETFIHHPKFKFP